MLRRAALGVGLVGALTLAAVGMAGADAPVAWKPDQQDPFDIQFTDPFNFTRPMAFIEIDPVDTPTSRLDELKAKGVRTVCYINAGAWENWRPDARDYPQSVIGRSLAGWAAERWLDIRRLDELRPILRKRLDLCRSRGFDGVDFGNVDGYANQTGFPITAADQLAFNRWLASEAHERQLAVSLRNDLEQVPELVQNFDYAISDSCLSKGECDVLRRFLEAGKPVFVVEYTNVRRKMDKLCAAAEDLGVQVIFKTKSLNGKLHRRCP